MRGVNKVPFASKIIPKHYLQLLFQAIKLILTLTD